MGLVLQEFLSALGRSGVRKVLLIGLAVTIVAGVVLYYLISLYVMSQAEKNVQNLLLSHRGIHLYIQRTMHPAYYKARDHGEVDPAFYSPEILSSSYIVRIQHQFYNEARKEAGLPEVYYKLAAYNPRNPVNKADALEEKLIGMFNADRNLKKYREIIELDGKKFLYVAMPFLVNQERCLKCHGDRNDAPYELQERYPGPGGFNEKVGMIRAIESIRAPIDKEYFTVYVISGAVLAGVLVIAGLMFFNSNLSVLVRRQTDDLLSEVEERKRAEEEVHQLNEELEARVADRTMQLAVANKELDSFAYSVSHDLRAPLRGIDGFSLALLEEYQDCFDETAKDYLNRVRAGCTRMGKLIDDLLKMSRLSRGEINLEEVNLSRLAEAIVNELHQVYPGRVVESVIAPGLTAHADPTLMRAVLENLLNNAWKFTGKRDEAHIEFNVVDLNGRKTFFVRDNGAGFNMVYADKLFQAFQRLHAAEDFEGTGIGLATVQRIIHRHGGDIWAEGEEGKGATFFFTLGK